MHYPVLLKETLHFLDPEPGDLIVDATFGGGGHTAAILQNIMPGGGVMAFDLDPEAMMRGRGRLPEFDRDITYINRDFRDLAQVSSELGIDSIDGAVFDLGISSYQVDDPQRGFSFLRDGPLDMRFSFGDGITAEQVVNSRGEEELREIVSKYGEERHASAVARAIVKARKEERITTTGRLSKIIKAAIGGKYRGQRLHSACRTFQALRIYVNDELGAIEEGVRSALALLKPGGRVCVISFHSIEDRAVKNIFREYKTRGKVNVLTKKPIKPSRDEVVSNPRSRSAKLRCAEKI